MYIYILNEDYQATYSLLLLPITIPSHEFKTKVKNFQKEKLN